MKTSPFPYFHLSVAIDKLDDMFFITRCAVICGCDGWVAIEKFANMKRSWFEQYLSLEHGIPSHDTFGRVFSLIDPEQFQVFFLIRTRI
jgi:hypothetical protein